MTQKTIKSILALCVVGAVVCQNPAPAPVGYVTPGPGPAPGPAPALVTTAAPSPTTVASPSPTTVASPSPTTVASPSPTTVAPTVATYTHQVSSSVSISNISALPDSEAAFINALAGAMGTASGGSAQVTISSMLVGSTFGGLADDLNTTKFIIAYATLTGIHHTTVTTNSASHPAAGGRRLAIDAVDPAAEGRRLAIDAVVEATITNDASTDIVQVAKSVAGATTVSGMTTQLNAQGVNTSSLALTQSPAVTATITATITGSNTSTINTAALASAVSNAVPGGATLSGTSVTTSGGPASTVQVTGTAAPSSQDDSGAISIVAPAMAIWAAMYAFMMA